MALREASLMMLLLVTDGTHDTPKRVKDGFPLIKAKEIGGEKSILRLAIKSRRGTPAGYSKVKT